MLWCNKGIYQDLPFGVFFTESIQNVVALKFAEDTLSELNYNIVQMSHENVLVKIVWYRSCHYLSTAMINGALSY